MSGAVSEALGKFLKPLSEAGAVLAQPETQVIVQHDDEPATSRYSWIQPPVEEPHGFSRVEDVRRTNRHMFDNRPAIPPASQISVPHKGCKLSGLLAEV